MKFDYENQPFTHYDISREDLLKANDKFFEYNAKDEISKKRQIPLTEYQRNYLSNWAKNLQYDYKAGQGKDDWGVYRCNNPHWDIGDDEVLKEILDIIDEDLGDDLFSSAADVFHSLIPSAALNTISNTVIGVKRLGSSGVSDDADDEKYQQAKKSRRSTITDVKEYGLFKDKTWI